MNLADAWWGCWEYARALRTYAEARAAATAAAYARGRAASELGRGIVLGSIGRYEEARALLAESLEVFRGLGDVWFVTYGLAHLSAVRAGQGDLDAALDHSREAATLAAAHGFGYPLALSQAHLLWQEEVRAPGCPRPRAADRGGALVRPPARAPRAGGAPGVGAAAPPVGRRLRPGRRPRRSNWRRRCARPRRGRR